MNHFRRPLTKQFLLIINLIIAISFSQTAMADNKPVIQTLADLPRADFALPAKPSELYTQKGEKLDELIEMIEKDAKEVLSTYDIKDANTEAGLLNTLYNTAFIKEDWETALKISPKVRTLQNKEAAKLLTNLSFDAYAKAAIKSGGKDSKAFADTFAKFYENSLKELPFEVVQDGLQAAKGQMEILTEALILGQVQSQFDTNAEAQGMVVGRSFASGIISVVKTGMLLKKKDALYPPLVAYLEANAVEKEDLWTERLVDLSKTKELTPVVTAVWDSGTDVSIFEDRIWVNTDETKNDNDDDGNGFVDDVSGIAFGLRNEPVEGSLMTLEEDDYANLDKDLDLIVGAMDLQANIDTEEAQNLRKRITSLSPEEVQPFMMKLSRLGFYTHGTMTAYTSVEDNPAARILYVRFSAEVKPVPDPIDEVYAASFVDYLNSTITYLKDAGTRVANLSWRISTPMIEGSLASIEPDIEKRKERALAIFETMSTAMETAVAAAPEILFVVGAGNEDEDVSFVKSFPAGIDAPNILTVGAVDSELKPAQFTSFGSTIDLYANGFEVKTKMPGGKKTMISGTSLSAPYVTNIASKLWAVDPSLTVAEVRNLIESTATPEGDRMIKVAHPKAAMEKLLN